MILQNMKSLFFDNFKFWTEFLRLNVQQTLIHLKHTCLKFQQMYFDLIWFWYVECCVTVMFLNVFGLFQVNMVSDFQVKCIFAVLLVMSTHLRILFFFINLIFFSGFMIVAPCTSLIQPNAVSIYWDLVLKCYIDWADGRTEPDTGYYKTHEPQTQKNGSN